MKKKAFTLTELLVVVVIIGVLAAVVLPRFTKVLEARRTTEAEDIMRAVRTEQEARCMLDKNYTAQKKDLASFPVNEGNNYTYAFNTVGMEAESKNKNYTLKMKSYADGGICCEGADCNSLGKNYPSCASYVAVANIECAAEGAPEPEPEPEPECNLPTTKTEICPSPQDGTIYYKLDEATCKYEEISRDCLDPAPEPECTGTEEQKISFVDCSTEKWRRCNNGTWEEFNKTVISTDCRHNCGKPEEEQACPQGTTGTQTRTITCNQSTGSWEAGEWTGECTPEACTPPNNGPASYHQPCSDVAGYELQLGSVFYTWNSSSCQYDVRYECSGGNGNNNGCTGGSTGSTTVSVYENTGRYRDACQKARQEVLSRHNGMCSTTSQVITSQCILSIDLLRCSKNIGEYDCLTGSGPTDDGTGGSGIRFNCRAQWTNCF